MLDGTARSSRGLLRVGLVFGEGPCVASDALRQLKRTVPDLEIQLIRVSNESAPADVISGDLDFALVSRFGLPARAADRACSRCRPCVRYSQIRPA